MRGSPELDVAGQYADSTSGLSFLHRAWRRFSDNQSSELVNRLGSSEENQRLTAAGDKPFQDHRAKLRIPNQHEARMLLDLYFDVCIATYRMLHRPTVEKWLSIVVENAEASRTLWHGLHRSQASIVLSVLAVASFHQDKMQSSRSFSPINVIASESMPQSDALFCEASEVSDAETGFPKLESAQSRIIQVLYLLMSSRMNQAWYTFGHTLQIISALGLHRREVRKRATNRRDYIEEQSRKRTFWVAYTLDKHLSVIFGRPRHYHDDDIDQDFPDLVNDEDMLPTGPLGDGTDDCHIESLVVHAKLAQIAERISREVYSIKPVPDHDRITASHRLGSELRRWRSSLPPFLGAIKPSSLIPSFRRQATALKLAYSHAVMLAHRPFLLKTNRPELRHLANESISECIAAAQDVLENVDRMERDGRLFHAFWWTHYVCFCALVVVYVWAIQRNDREDTHNASLFDLAERCLKHLAEATATNSPSRRYAIILQELRTEAKKRTARRSPEAIQPPANPRQSGGAQSSVPPNEWGLGSPVSLEPTIPSMASFLDDWQTTDWLDLDSSAFGPFPSFDASSIAWTS
ncbi:fungal-specific transcription factor domain-containing protein [Lophiotrema nucula]|uniref:Fungal-specific transcription factor domain-containing protein n=1 Tax=Lophiotrema nucula TaxID=690887 RepID=A0A6A5YHU2_9PLEO|nr:fungal-specific transcription factor domain-containing protein [Lophiotrema nucula]